MLNKNFILVVIGQIVSLFGNAILRFALPLHLLRETGSSAIFGIVTAMAFIPMVVLSMIGGILADRVNKRNIMVMLDMITAIIVVILYCVLNIVPLVPLIAVVLMLLYGISGTYQPSVQACIPLLVQEKQLIQGNGIVNQINTLANLLGPVIGGILFGLWGFSSILMLSVICFASAAFMELFIEIPFEKRPAETGIFTLAGRDLQDSFNFVKKEKPVFFAIVLIIALFNLVLTSAMIVGIPILIVKVLDMSDVKLGIAQGILALGGLFGGLLTTVVGHRFKFEKAYILLEVCSVCIGCMGVVLITGASGSVKYMSIMVLCFFMMTAASVFTIQIFTMIQKNTPTMLTGKIMAAFISVALSAQPIGQGIYGFIFQWFINETGVVFISTAIIAVPISVYAKKIFSID